jgi:hypothetical protein
MRKHPVVLIVKQQGSEKAKLLRVLIAHYSESNKMAPGCYSQAPFLVSFIF